MDEKPGITAIVSSPKLELRVVLEKYGLMIAVGLLSIALALVAPNFLTLDNILAISRQIAMQGIIAVGATMLILAGFIDLSLGPQVAMASALIGVFAVNLHIPLLPAILLTVVAGVLIGFINGLITVRYRIPDFITTLATTTILNGAALVVTRGYPISGFPPSFSWLGQGSIWFIPVPATLMLIIYAVGHFVLSRTRFGRYVYLIGDNREAARRVGVRDAKLIISLFTIVGLLCAISGVLLSSRIMTGSPVAGNLWTLDIIASVFIGGIILGRPTGTVLGTLMGTILIGILTNGMILMSISPYIQLIVRGAVILLAVLANTTQERKRH